MIKKTRKIFLFMCMLCFLSGCERKSVVMDPELISDTKEDGQEADNSTEKASSEEEVSDGTKEIRKMLGMGDDWVWSTSLDTQSGPVNIHARILLPATNGMQVVKVKKKFYSGQDRKRLLETMLDKDSIRLDVEHPCFPTKHNLQSKISAFQKAVNALEGKEDRRVEEQSVFKYNIEKYQELLASAPDSVSPEDLGDYSYNYYIGSKDGTSYRVCFKSDEDLNISEMKMQNTQLDMVNGLQSWNYYVLDNIYNENICSMTEDEALAKAKEFLYTLGINDMKCEKISYLEFYKPAEDIEGDKNEQPIDQTETNGYEFIFSREIVDVAIDNTIYLTEGQNMSMGMVPFVYAPEKIVIDINDSEIFKFEYFGIAEETSERSEVKLLSYEQIKDIFCQNILDFQKTDILGNLPEYKYLMLDYARISDPEDKNVFSYVPVWKLGSYYEDDIHSHSTFFGTQIWINAIDGSVIDPQKEKYTMSYVQMFNEDVEMLSVDEYLEDEYYDASSWNP